MDYDAIRNFLEDGSMSSTKLDNFTRSELIAGHYLLFLTKTSYYLVPVSSFKTEEDLHWFKVNILGKIRMPGFL